MLLDKLDWAPAIACNGDVWAHNLKGAPISICRQPDNTYWICGGVYPFYKDLEPIVAQAVLYHLLSKYGDKKNEE